MRSGIILIKYWFSITDEEQQFRFTMRIQNPLKQWKLSPMDVQARSRWEQYTKAKEAMLEHTHRPDSPWWIGDAVDKKRARRVSERLSRRAAAPARISCKAEKAGF
jgi:polyphosphate kinase 2 (PPK2 family)